MLVWNRKNIYVGWSLQDYNKIIDCLIKNNIKYDCRVVDNGVRGRDGRNSYSGNLCEDSRYMLMYYIYVNKNNFDEAKHIINQS